MATEEENSQVLERSIDGKTNRDEPWAKIQAAAVYHSGPLPLSSELKNYEMIVPGAGERILKMAENESIRLLKLIRKKKGYASH